MGYSPWGRKESDTTERLHFHFHLRILRYSGEPKVRGWELSAPDVGIKEFRCTEVYMAEPSKNSCHFYYHPMPMVLNNAINEVFLKKKFFVSYMHYIYLLLIYIWADLLYGVF